MGVAIAIAASLAACGGNNNSNDNSQASAAGPEASSLYAPVSQNAVIPFPNNLLFVDANNTTGLLAGVSADGTLNIPDATGANPVIADANKLDGFSTTDNLYADFSGADIDVATANNGSVRVIDAATGSELAAGTDFDVVKSPDVVDHTRLLIRPLKPLDPATTYYVVITDQLKTTDGGRVAPSDQFAIADSASAVGSDANPAAHFSAAQQASLESIRSQQIRPILDSVSDASASNVVVAWQFTTQSIGASLRYVAAHPTPNPNGSSDGGIRVQPLPNGQGGQLSTGDINANLPDTANIYQGTVDLSYYLAAAAHNGTATPAPLTTYWVPDDQMSPEYAPGHAPLPTPNGGSIPCSVLTASDSTTGCFPYPKVRSVQSVPVLVAVPNANSPSGGQPPAGGWPVVIFQHGITGDRTNMFAVAPALAAAGFVTVAIDLPLHGLAPGKALAIAGHERTFDLDANGDGVVDPSGANFINLTSPITSRDNLREAVADLIDLNATVMQGSITVVGGNAIKLNGQPSQFLGHSLGAIVGSTLMGVTSNQAFDAATLANPGGGVIRLLGGSAAFGPKIAAGLKAAGVGEGSAAYQNFLRLAQTIVDGGDPINYAKTAAVRHPLHMIEVVGGGNGGVNPPDLVVPNAVPANVGPDFMPATSGACPATAGYTPALDTVCVGGPLSGTNPLVAAMGLASVAESVPFQAGSQPADSVVRFASGAHSTILDPTAGTANGSVDPQEGAATSAEMQCESAGFLAAAAAGAASPTIPLGCRQ
ncbi:Lipase-like protein [Salinisphaera sp. LB1]|nr:Lipase-like protein [Salinisphaera sp. LB1]